MDSLKSMQQTQLTALLDELDRFSTSDLIVRCQEAIGLDPTVEADQKRMDVAAAGAWAHDRAVSYLDRLRLLNKERVEVGGEIRQLLQYPYPTAEEEIEEAAWARVLAPHLAGRQEVVLNFFCVSVQHICSLLKIVADAVEYEIPLADLDYLDEFRHLRNHFEHWYNRLPGNTHEAVLITKTVTAGGYHIRGGLEIDAQDRIIVIEPTKSGPVTHVVDVTNDGVARVERIVQETDAKVRELAIEQVRAHFIAHPDQDIPSPDDVRKDLLISAAGYEPKPNSTNGSR